MTDAKTSPAHEERPDTRASAEDTLQAVLPGCTAAGDGETNVHPDLTAFIESIPWHQHLGLKVLALSPGHARLVIPFQPGFTGNAARGALHGGIIASLADSCGNAALWTHFGPADRIATINIGVDYFRPAPLADLMAEAEVRLLGNRIGNVHVRLAPLAEPSLTVAEGRTVCYVKRMS